MYTGARAAKARSRGRMTRRCARRRVYDWGVTGDCSHEWSSKDEDVSIGAMVGGHGGM